MLENLCYCCQNKSSFIIRLGNEKENEERMVCRNLRHMVDALVCYPDRVYNRISGEDYPVLKNILRRVMGLKPRNNTEALERLSIEGQEIINSLPIPGQLELDFM